MTRSRPYAVNLGLPRTGTSSFAAATRRLGFETLHIWPEAEEDPEVLAAARANRPDTRRHLSTFATLSDTPFYAMRADFERHYPDTVLLYTTRDRDGWVESMVRMREAGGSFLTRLYGMPDPPHTRDRAEQLAAVYDRHHASTCRGLDRIDLDHMDDRERWTVLCAAFPNGDDLFDRIGDEPWPWIAPR